VRENLNFERQMHHTKTKTHAHNRSVNGVHKSSIILTIRSRGPTISFRIELVRVNESAHMTHRTELTCVWVWVFVWWGEVKEAES
jgi:hypothetical protein